MMIKKALIAGMGYVFAVYLLMTYILWDIPPYIGSWGEAGRFFYFAFGALFVALVIANERED